MFHTSTSLNNLKYNRGERGEGGRREGIGEGREGEEIRLRKKIKRGKEKVGYCRGPGSTHKYISSSRVLTGCEPLMCTGQQVWFSTHGGEPEKKISSISSQLLLPYPLTLSFLILITTLSSSLSLLYLPDSALPQHIGPSVPQGSVMLLGFHTRGMSAELRSLTSPTYIVK